VRKKLLVLVVTLLLLVVSVAFVGAQEEIIVGLITKTETNPFFVICVKVHKPKRMNSVSPC